MLIKNALFAPIAVSLTFATPVVGQTNDEPPKPSDPAKMKEMCYGVFMRPSWCDDADVPPFEQPKPTSRAAQQAECAGRGAKPSWCDDDDVKSLSNPNATRIAENWTVTLRSDDMDVDKYATLEAPLYEPGGIAGKLTINVWNGGSIITHSSTPGGRSWWPWCETNLDRISVDNGPVQYLAAIERGGDCDRIAHNGRAVSAMKRGSTAKIRVNREYGTTDYSLNLTGFTAAYNRAVQLTRR